MQSGKLTRRGFVIGSTGAAAAVLTGCSTTTLETSRSEIVPIVHPVLETTYGPIPNEQFPLPAIPYQKIDKRYYRQMVSDPTGERPGTLVVTARLLPWGICLDACGDVFVEDEAIEELLPCFCRPTRVAEHLPEFVNAIVC